MKSWQIYAAADKILSSAFLQRLYTRSYSLIKSWAAGPMCEKRNRNPIDRITLMLAELDIHGRGDVARAAVDIMAKPLGGHFAYFENTESDKGTVDGEVADMTVALGRLADTCRAAMSDGEVGADERGAILDQLRKAHRELNQIMNVVLKAEKS